MKAILFLVFLQCLAASYGYSPLFASSSNKPSWVSPGDKVEISRRNILASSATMAMAGLMIHPSTVYAAEELINYEDEQCKFSMKVPSTWEKSTQSLPDRRKIVLYVKPDSDKKSLVFVAYTPVRSDFTSLGSFGSVDEVAQATILPKSTLANIEGVDSKMLSAESKKQAYFFDYTQTVPGQPKTHFRTIFSFASAVVGGAGNLLVSITAQTPESDYESLKPLFDEIIDSYK